MIFIVKKRVRSRRFDLKCRPEDTILFYSCILLFASVLYPIKFIIGKHYRESAARILLPCAVMLRTRTVIMADRLCPYFGDYFCCFCFGNGTSYFSFGKESIKWLILDKTRTGKRHDSRFLSFFRLQLETHWHLYRNGPRVPGHFSP